LLCFRLDLNRNARRERDDLHRRTVEIRDHRLPHGLANVCAGGALAELRPRQHQADPRIGRGRRVRPVQRWRRVQWPRTQALQLVSRSTKGQVGSVSWRRLPGLQTGQKIWVWRASLIRGALRPRADLNRD
jgi:hypothetical protein